MPFPIRSHDELVINAMIGSFLVLLRPAFRQSTFYTVGSRCNSNICDEPKGENHKVIMQHDASEIKWAELMCQAQQGDEKAYSLLLRDLSSALQKKLRRQFGYASFIDDCVQESLLAVHAARHTYQPHRPFKPWL